ncbi:MAG: alpha/beta hydrolase [Proteobacteria bacterium]|nr:alpha/beta hydrolase [Pseudomonadota bacterium]MDA1057592.1 alpha/beta hydrolase [Pseudomonadota bacterium]
MVKQHRAYIQTAPPQDQIHARYAGDSGPAIFLLHQLPISCRQMERLIPLLGEQMRVWGLDTPGYGISPSTLTQQTFVEYARRLLEAIDALGVEHFALLGTEIGVAMAAEIARQAGRERVAHFIALAAPPSDPAGHQAFLTELGEPAPQQDGSHLLPIWQFWQRRWGADTDNATLRMACTENTYIYSRYHWGLRAYADYDLAAGLKQIACPALFLSAERDLMKDNTAAAAALVPGAEHRILDGTRAPLVSTEAEKLTEIITAFVGAG